MLPRTIQSQIENSLFKGKVIVLYGPRRVGKTTIAKLVLDSQKPKGISTKYMICEEPDVQTALTKRTSQDMRQFLGDTKLVVLDEAQAIKDIGQSLKLLVDNYDDIQIIATGSSSFALSNSVIEPLTGRKFEFMLYPFSVNEISTELDEIELRRRFDDFLRFGLYPDVYNSDYRNPESILKELSGSYLFKDIFKFKGIRNPEFLLKLLQILALRIGEEISFTELAGTLGIDKKTIVRYIDLLEKAFIIFRLPPLNRDLLKEVGKTRKFYFYDLGIRNSLINNFNQLELRNDVEVMWENFVIVERKKYLDNNQISYNHFFWRTYDNKSVDYVEERDGKLWGYDIEWKETTEVKAPEEFIKTYKESGLKSINQENAINFMISK